MSGNCRVMHVFYMGAGSPAWNMAVDEALFLMDFAALRFYSWTDPAYSIGYFQRVGGLSGDLPVVRRITGGGTVRHGEDLTFSIAVDMNWLGTGMSIRESYWNIHQCVRSALGKLAIEVEFYGGKENGGPFCFQSPCAGDLLKEGRKVAGGAQRRRAGRLLHQGSLYPSWVGADPKPFREHLSRMLAMRLNCDIKERLVDSSALNNMVQELRRKYESDEWNCKF